MAPIITLTTDFGWSDTYVGVMKGVILGLCREARIVDLTHEIAPQNVLGGAIAIESSLRYFPEGTIHVGVVDPGVGTERAAVAIETDQSILVGPDNGLFSFALTAQSLKRAVRLTNRQYFRPSVSDTFHGRDVFAPVAAHLANGVALADLGEPLDDLTTLLAPEPVYAANRIESHVLHVDRFGNLITDLRVEEFDSWRRRAGVHRVRVSAAGHSLGAVQRTFADAPPGDPLAYFGSGGRLELAVSAGSAHEFLELDVGDSVLVIADDSK
ncbi:MAG: S-adenosyl-l-methionine hydroxide adenosyltransferase family protein [Phycisphaerales bacterium]